MQTIKDIVRVVKHIHYKYLENLQFILETNQRILSFG